MDAPEKREEILLDVKPLKDTPHFQHANDPAIFKVSNTTGQDRLSELVRNAEDDEDGEEDGGGAGDANDAA